MEISKEQLKELKEVTKKYSETYGMLDAAEKNLKKLSDEITEYAKNLDIIRIDEAKLISAISKDLGINEKDVSAFIFNTLMPKVK